MLTSLYLMKVLPASTPWAALKTMVMVGPSLRMRWIAMPIATTAARIGTIQTTEIRWRRLGTTVARGRLSGLSAMLVLRAGVLSHPVTVTLISFTTKDQVRQGRNQIRNDLPQRRKGRKENSYYPNLALFAPWRENLRV